MSVWRSRTDTLFMEVHKRRPNASLPEVQRSHLHPAATSKVF